MGRKEEGREAFCVLFFAFAFFVRAVYLAGGGRGWRKRDLGGFFMLVETISVLPGGEEWWRFLTL